MQLGLLVNSGAPGECSSGRWHLVPDREIAPGVPEERPQGYMRKGRPKVSM